MKELTETLSQRIDKNSRIRIWHVLMLLALLWAVPITLPAQYDIVLGIAGIAGYFWSSHLIKRASRVSVLDIILIERFFILLGFLWPTIWTIIYGMRHGFGTLITIALIAEVILLSLLSLGIVLHIKNIQKYYHGVKKDELFK